MVKAFTFGDRLMAERLGLRVIDALSPLERAVATEFGAITEVVVIGRDKDDSLMLSVNGWAVYVTPKNRILVVGSGGTMSFVNEVAEALQSHPELRRSFV